MSIEITRYIGRQSYEDIKIRKKDISYIIERTIQTDNSDYYNRGGSVKTFIVGLVNGKEFEGVEINQDQIREWMQEEDDELKQLKEEMEELKELLVYAPGSSNYNQALQDFNSRR
jgi:hypothetical protein